MHRIALGVAEDGEGVAVVRFHPLERGVALDVLEPRARVREVPGRGGVGGEGRASRRRVGSVQVR